MPDSRPARSAVFFVIVTAFVDSMIVGIVLPLFPRLLMELGDTDVSGAAAWGGFATLLYAAMQFIFSPIIGGLSDRFGRRPVLLLSLAALSADMILLGLSWSIWVFLAARTLSGIFAATYSTANAYIADTVPASERAKSYGLVGAAFGVGFIAGPALGGLVGEIDLRAPFYLAAGLAALTTVYGYFFVPESLSPGNRRPFSWTRSNSFGTLARLLKTSGLGILIPVFFFATLSSWVYPAVWSYVAIAKFNWTEGEIGASLTYYGVIFVVSQTVMIRALLPKLGVRRTIWISLALEGVSLTGLGFAPNAIVVYALITVALLTALQDPALREVMSARVAEDAQGELQGGLSALSGLAMVFSPVLYTQLFSTFTDGSTGIRFPGAPFVVASAFSFLAVLLYGVRRRPAAVS